ncbi:DUF1800 domain-containing protein [Duganella aceris]|uniref:DUF1800 domain-containing protein n=1 Tax=Duganella aceris TaxID=2703883 RepID=A0ABX0FJL6_9BURK|nr:DUF1800 domain-containing protein [Duganella aceris]NGZ84704.1 DUF1800 domain-containing protein [Duganella aceris]
MYAVLIFGLSACGGTTAPADVNGETNSVTATSARTVMGGRSLAAELPSLTAASVTTGDATTAAVSAGVTPAAASQFLAQATFGPTEGSIAEVASIGPEAWFDTQFRKPQSLHRIALDQLRTTLAPGLKVTPPAFYNSFWRQVVTGPDQLRQRVQFALSQIFVISFDSNVATFPRGGAAYYDMLGQQAFGNFRQLLESVARHPMMGIYLSYLRNQKESDTRTPDENFAREVMQLMTIGLYQLNPDGMPKLVNGKPVETYTAADVAGLAKVFTGWSWAGPDLSTARFLGGVPDADRDWKPMQNYPWFHSTSEKRFLGKTISGATTGEADLKVALDTLFQHPNVGPFIGKQLIQRLVTSNPSRAYVTRVSAVFADNGAGVRGDMKALIKAILLDPEARAVGVSGREKVREPVLRLANWMRAFKVNSLSGNFNIDNTDDPLSALGQTPLRSPSVFNFFRPGYVPPNTPIATANQVAPEMQLVSEPEIIGYLNYMQIAIAYGMGGGRDMVPNYVSEMSLSNQPEKLADRINLLILNGNMSAGLRAQIIAAINATPIPVAAGTTAEAQTTARYHRVYIAIYLAMISPEYLIQK